MVLLPPPAQFRSAPVKSSFLYTSKQPLCSLFSPPLLFLAFEWCSAMEFLLSMSILSPAADVSREKGKVQEWIRAWVAREDGKGAAAEPRRRRQSEPRSQEASRAQGKKPQGRPSFAPQFDGLHCFETIVSH